MRTVTVDAALLPVPPALRSEADLDQILAHMSEHDDAAVPVVEADGSLVGILTAATVETFTTTDSTGTTTAGALAHAPAPLGPASTLEQAVQALAWTEDPGLPVLGENGEELVGWVTHRSVLRAYHRERDRLTPKAEADAREG